MSNDKHTQTPEQICIGLLHVADDLEAHGYSNDVKIVKAAMEIVNQHEQLKAEISELKSLLSMGNMRLATALASLEKARQP